MVLFRHKNDWVHSIGIVLLIVVPAVAGNAAEDATGDPAKTLTTAAPRTVPVAPAVIPLEEAAMQATQVQNMIRGFATTLADTNEVESIEKFLPDFRANLALEFKSTTNILKEQPALETLQAQEEIWQQKRLQLTHWLNVLTNRATKLQIALTQLNKLEEIWSRTRDVEEANAPDPILHQIKDTLAAIQSAQHAHRSQRDELLKIQSLLADEVASCNTALAQIGGLQQIAVGGLLTRQNPAIWNSDLSARAKLVLSYRLPQVAASYWADILQYVRDSSGRMPRHVAIFIGLSLMLLAARRRLNMPDAAGDRSVYGTVVFDHVFAGALLVTLMIATAPSSPVPVTVKRLFQIAGLVPIIILTRRAVPHIFGPSIYALAILFAIDTVRRAIASEPPMGQGVLILEALIGIVVVCWLLVCGARQAARSSSETSMLRQFVAGSIVFVLCVGLVAAIFGYMRLARLAIPGVLAGGAVALELYASVQVGMGLVAYAFRVRPLVLLQSVQHHRSTLERRIYRTFLWLIAGGWLVRYLDYLGLLQPAQSIAAELLNTRLERGSINTSVGDIGAFFLTVLVAYLLSSFIRFVLEEDVYPRTRIAMGQSYALSSLLNYTILAVGFLLAVGLLGVDMTKVTVLAGAFGVGIGFGLQGVVNNFVSGLILLFERPIHVGDWIQLGNLQARVHQIGIRASIVRTRQGAEIIVPNANLITQEVTNWTLSDKLRRLDLQVGVNYGAAPKKVIDLLETVARTHAKILKQPAPRCLFMSYGDSSINFELRAWTEYSNSQQVRSDLTVAIYDAVYAAGMSFPFPQREVRVLGDENGSSTIAPVRAVDKKG